MRSRKVDPEGVLRAAGDDDREVRRRRYGVGEVAAIAGVSVRTLHHYDAIGLLRPVSRGENGYRRYGIDDLDRLQRILAYRELGFGLDAIATLLDDPDIDRVEHLRRQAALLDARMERLDAVRTTLRKTMEAHHMGIELDPKDMLEVFGNTDPAEHAEEAEQRWGDTDAFRQSRERARHYDKDAWLRIRDEGDDIDRRFADAFAAGIPADDPRARDVAEAHRRHIGRWFYDVTTEMHVGLADMYEADPRFREHYDARAAGLASYVAAAIRANAHHAGA